MAKVAATGATVVRLVHVADIDGRSGVLADDNVAAMPRPNGAVVHELWRSTSLPVRRSSLADRPEPDPAVPSLGAVVRRYTVPPDAPGFDPVADLHTNDNLYVISVVDGRIDIVLETAHVVLSAGESVVLPGSMHSLCNSSGRDAVVLYTAFAMAD